MSSIPQVSEAMQTILAERAKAMERESGFVQRASAVLDGARFVQTCVLTWMHQPRAGYGQLRHTAASLGAHVSKQAIEQRFGAASSRLLRRLLEEGVGRLISSEACAVELLRRFNGVYLQDGTLISLPASLAGEFEGSGKPGQEAALRVQARFEWTSGCLEGLWLQAGREAERSGAPVETALPPGSLFNADLGYFTLRGMRERGEQEQYWLTQAKATLCVREEQGQWSDLLSFLQRQRREVVDVPVVVGKREQVRVRLTPEQAQRRRDRANRDITHPPKGCQVQIPGCVKGPHMRRGKPKRKKVSAARLRLGDWTILLTNVPASHLSAQEALVLARCRWQIELFWKLCKQDGQLDTWASQKPERILSQIYAKLLGVLITHWQTLLGCWQAPNRSLVKAKQVVTWMTPGLALAFGGLLPLAEVVGRTSEMMSKGCTVDTRRTRPNTYQLLADPSLNSS